MPIAQGHIISPMNCMIYASGFGEKKKGRLANTKVACSLQDKFGKRISSWSNDRCAHCAACVTSDLKEGEDGLMQTKGVRGRNVVFFY